MNIKAMRRGGSESFKGELSGAALAITSSSGKATETPAPRNKVRREIGLNMVFLYAITIEPLEIRRPHGQVRGCSLKKKSERFHPRLPLHEGFEPPRRSRRQ